MFGQVGARWLHHQKNKITQEDVGGIFRSRGGITRRLTPYGLVIFAAGLRKIDNGESVDRVCNWARRKNNGATEPISL